MDQWLLLGKVIGGILSLALGITALILGIYLRRVYHSIDLLFAKLEAVDKRMRRLERAIIRLDPSQTQILE